MSLIDKITMFKQVLSTILKIAEVIIKIVDTLIDSLKGVDNNG